MKHNIKNLIPKDEPAKMIETVLTIFQEINKTANASKTQIFELVRLFKSQPAHFQSAFELAYLKIFKIFHEKASRKMPPKFQQLATTFFQEIIPKDIHSDQPAVTLFNFFLEMLAEGVFSSLSGIRITTARMLFHLIKLGGQQVLHTTKKQILRAIFFLIRLKVSTYKQVGIKLASLVLGWQHELTSKIQDELFKILAVQDNEQIRKMAMTNMLITKDNLSKVLIRLRDKSPDIKSIIIRKLLGQKYPLEQMNINHLYHLLYDGYGNKDNTVEQETLKYFGKFFQREDKKYAFLEFIDMFRPNQLLMYPNLYTLFDSLIADVVEEISINNLVEFTRKFTNTLKQISKNGHKQPLRELIWLKNIGRSENAQLKNVFEECVPSGTELSKLLLDLIDSQDVFSIYECLQIFSMQKFSDQLGRNKMFDSLKTVVTRLQFFEVEQNWESLESDDICSPLTLEQITQKKMLLSYFDLPIICNSYDLIYEIGIAMRALWPDHYEIELKQVMAEWNNPEENNLIKEKELTLANIKKMEEQKNMRVLESLQNKLNNIEEQLQRENTKTRLIILTLSRLRSTTSMDDFLPVIKEDLAKKDQSQGLILLGLYCLQNIDRVQNFLPLYWMHLCNAQNSKLHTLVTLKVTTDFMVKFNLSSYQCKQGQQEQFSNEKYIKKILSFVFSNDHDIRILAVEGLCRLIYHNRVEEILLGSSFMRLLLLWWDTSSEEVSARTVHTISIFVKQYIERGLGQIRKLSQSLCIFFKILLIEQGQRRMINKRKVSYNLKVEQFIKRSVVIAMTVLKYHKQSKQIIWRYQQSGAELGPQELFLIFLFKHSDMHFCLEKAINIADFHEEAPLQTLILVKKQIEIFFEKSADGSYTNNKRLEATLKKLESQIVQKIDIKNQQTFNDEMLNGLKKQLQQYQQLIFSEAIRLAVECETDQIFVQNLNAPVQEGNSDEESDLSEQNINEVIGQIEDADLQSFADIKQQQKGDSRGQKKVNLSRISEGNEEEDRQGESKMNESKNKKGNIKKEEKKGHSQRIDKRNNRKRPPSPSHFDDGPKPTEQSIIPIPSRTRSRHKV